jgi:hypothetical protein
MVDLDVGWTSSNHFSRFMISKIKIKQIFFLGFLIGLFDFFLIQFFQLICF